MTVPENDVVSFSEFPKALEDTEVIQVGPPAKRCRLRKVQKDTCSSNSRAGKDYFDVSEYESDSSEWERLSDFSSSDSSDDSDWTQKVDFLHYVWSYSDDNVIREKRKLKKKMKKIKK